MMNSQYYPQQGGGGGGGPPPPQQQQQQQQQYGSGSYAARSQQAYGQQAAMQQQQQQQVQYQQQYTPQTQVQPSPSYQPQPQPPQPTQYPSNPTQPSYQPNNPSNPTPMPSNQTYYTPQNSTQTMNQPYPTNQTNQTSRSSIMSINAASQQQFEAEEQARLLAEATRSVQSYSAEMRDAMDQGILSTVLDRAVLMLSELGEMKFHGNNANGGGGANGQMQGQYQYGQYGQTPSSSTTKTLSPKNYYELHMMAIAELPSLEEFLLSMVAESNVEVPMNQPPPPTTSMKDLYEIIQYCPKLLPRLYLQICAGSALVRSGEVYAKVVLKELIDTVKCVQCPVRGMFLRHYLLQAMRDKLPDDLVDGEESGNGNGAGNGSGAEGASETPASDTPGSPTPTSTATPTTSENPNGTVKDSYEFVLANFIEMNKLWVRIQHLPGDQKTKEVRRKRERERNDLRVLVGTNLVRLSELEGVTSTIYGTVILPKILDQIVACRDPLAQAYLMDCIIQVFPDEFHLETMEIVLNVCPKLRDKVNIRTILQSIMDRLSSYYDDELLLNDDQDVNDVKTALMLDAYQMFHECIKKVFEARGAKISSKEVIRLESSLLDFSLKCYPGRMDYIDSCLEVCASHLRGERSSVIITAGEGNVMDRATVGVPLTLDDASIQDLEKLLSLPLETLALGVLDLHHYSGLLACLPPANQKVIALGLLQSVVSSKMALGELNKVEQLLVIISPLLQEDASLQDSMHSIKGAPSQMVLVSHFIKLLQSDDFNVHLEMLCLVKDHLTKAGNFCSRYAMPPLIFSSLDLIDDMLKSMQPVQEEVKEGDLLHMQSEEATGETNTEGDAAVGNGEEATNTPEEVPKESPSADEVQSKIADCRKIFLLIQKALATLKQSNAEMCFALTLKVVTAADRCASVISSNGGNGGDFASIAYEYMTQAFFIYDADVNDSKSQMNAITMMNGTLLACKSFAVRDYDTLITKTTQCAARLLKKPDQCKMILLCSHLFYRHDDGAKDTYKNPQRVLECLQRALKIADACTMTSPSDFYLFVDILDRYVYFFEKETPSITDKFVTGLIALINGQITNIGPYDDSIVKAKGQFKQLLCYIQRKQSDPDSPFAPIVVGQVPP